MWYLVLVKLIKTDKANTIPQQNGTIFEILGKCTLSQLEGQHIFDTNEPLPNMAIILWQEISVFLV